VNMRFDPAGMTDDPDIRMAQSFMDYIFRRLALDYLPYEDRTALGIFTAEERAQTVSGGQPLTPPSAGLDIEGLQQSAPVNPDVAESSESSNETGGAPKADLRSAHSTAELMEAITGTSADAPLCMTCGIKMRPAGSCYVCEGCGATSGCS